MSTRQPRSLFLFELERPKAAGIGDGTLRAIVRLGGVTEINPVAALRIPVQARVSYMGYNYRSDILAFGVPYRLVAGDLAGTRYRRMWNDPAREKVIPVLVPRTILRSFNDGMAAANGLPRVSERGTVGFGFRLLVGKSSIRALEGHEESDAVVAGFTDQVDSFALHPSAGPGYRLQRQVLPGPPQRIPVRVCEGEGSRGAREGHVPGYRRWGWSSSRRRPFHGRY